MAAVDSEKYFLEKEQLPVDDSDEEYNYEEVPLDEEYVPPDSDEDLDAAVRTINEAAKDSEAAQKHSGSLKPTVNQRPEVVDDFVRNFLVKMGMSRTLDTFQIEWYELQQTGKLNDEDVGVVPDVYQKNQELDGDVKHLRKEVTKFKDAALKAKETYVKLRKERDFHRMHHKRVVQEKNKLINDIKRLKAHYASYEPTLRQLKQKYESAMKEKMLTKLERDRAVGQVHGLQNTIKSMDGLRTSSGTHVQTLVPKQCGSAVILVDKDGRGPTQRALAKEAAKEQPMDIAKPSWEGVDVRNQEPKDYNDTHFPKDNGTNPHLSQIKGPCGHITRSGGFRLTNSFQAHSNSVSGLSLHPRKQVLATTSDDKTWKLWSVPGGDVIMTGEGHSDWISDCDFHPSGTRLATASGDCSIKIWDFAKAECVHTFTEHTHAVWACSWHTCGNFLATSSMDNTSKIWDLGSLRCRNTLRGHADSVNAVEFLPYSNTLVTGSADKTASLWDARNGLCAQTFYGHAHAVNHVTFNLRGDTLATCDAFGEVKLWDVRTGTPMTSLDAGPHAANKVAFDAAGTVLAIASSDRTVKMYEVANGQISTLVGHDNAVQTVIFDRSGDFLVSGGSDMTVRIWS